MKIAITLFTLLLSSAFAQNRVLSISEFQIHLSKGIKVSSFADDLGYQSRAEKRAIRKLKTQANHFCRKRGSNLVKANLLIKPSSYHYDILHGIAFSCGLPLKHH